MSLQNIFTELKGDLLVVPTDGATYFTVQITPEDYGATSGVIEIRKSLSGDTADAVSFSPALQPNMTSRAIAGPVECFDVPFLHIDNTTADTGKHCTIHLYLSTADRGGNT